MDSYKITDLYIAAFLRAIGYECEITTQGKRCFFSFPIEAKVSMGHFISQMDSKSYNVNASTLVNEIKQLKSYVNNL